MGFVKAGNAHQMTSNQNRRLLKLPPSSTENEAAIIPFVAKGNPSPQPSLNSQRSKKVIAILSGEINEAGVSQPLEPLFVLQFIQESFPNTTAGALRASVSSTAVCRTEARGILAPLQRSFDKLQ
jgi:hypothetical protein